MGENTSRLTAQHKWGKEVQLEHNHHLKASFTHLNHSNLTALTLVVHFISRLLLEISKSSLSFLPGELASRYQNS